MTGAVDTAKDVYKATKEVRGAIDTYNRALLIASRLISDKNSINAVRTM